VEGEKLRDPAGEVLEIIARNLKKAGWSLGYVSAVDSNGRTIWIVDAHRGDGQRFIWPVFVLSPCSDFAAEQRAIPAVSACNTPASIQPCVFGDGHAC
jgi:hypothetical protein